MCCLGGKRKKSVWEELAGEDGELFQLYQLPLDRGSLRIGIVDNGPLHRTMALGIWDKAAQIGLQADNVSFDCYIDVNDRPFIGIEDGDVRLANLLRKRKIVRAIRAIASEMLGSETTLP